MTLRVLNYGLAYIAHNEICEREIIMVAQRALQVCGDETSKKWSPKVGSMYGVSEGAGLRRLRSLTTCLALRFYIIAE